MYTLSDSSRQVKKFIQFGGLFIIAAILIFILFKIIFIVKDTLYPPQVAKAESAFGKLTPQFFPQSSTNANLSYTINTLTGFLPNTELVVNVYRYQIIKPDLLGLSKFQEKIAKIRFLKDYTAISDNIFEWSVNTNGLTKTLRANVQTGNFEINSPFIDNADIISGNNLPDQKNAISSATRFLTNMDSLPSDLDMDKTKVNLFTISNGNLIPATSLSTTQVYEMNFIQADVDKLPIAYDNPKSSNIRLLIGGGDSYNGDIISAKYLHQNLSSEKSTYSLKTSDMAYNDLKSGKGYIATYTGNSNNVSINNVYLAYYISSQPQDYLMPIFVFTGNDNYVAYVPAIRDEWINK